MEQLRIMMTGAGAPGAPGIIKCYRNNGEREVFVLGVDARENISTRNKIDAFEKVPLAEDTNFVDKILQIAIAYEIDVIQPLVTRELEVLAKAVSRFEDKNIKLCVSPIENLEIANDKRKLLETLKRNGITVPDFICAHNYEEFIDACDTLNYLEKTICFKPSKANGSRGFRIIDRKVDRFDILFNKKPNSTYISYEEMLDIIKNQEIPELLVMEYLPGDEYSVDMLMNNGKTIYALARLRNSMNGGISTDCTVVNAKDVIEYSKEVAESLNLHGNIGVQVRRDVLGNPKILEINPRVQGTIVCCAAAGVNLPYYGIKVALGEQIPNVKVNWNTRMIRYWDECYYDVEGQPYSY